MTDLSPAAGPVRRGEIRWVNFDPTRGGEIRKTRPAVVVTADALNRARRTVVVVPLSTGPHPRPPLVVATPSAGPGSVADLNGDGRADIVGFANDGVHAAWGRPDGTFEPS